MKNLRIIGTGLLLSGLVVLIATDWKTANISLDSTAVSYDAESGKPAGFLSYEEVSQNVKVVTLEEDGNQFEELMYVQKHSHDFPLSKSAVQYRTDYIRLEDGWEMVSYEYAGEEEQESRNPIRTYGLFTVVKEEKFLDYLLEYVGRKEKYDVEEILEVYQEKVSSETKKSQGDVKTYGQKN